MTCPLCGGPDPAECRCTAACFMCGQYHKGFCPQRTECERYGHIFHRAGEPKPVCQREGCYVDNPRYAAWVAQDHNST
jgi:hypothetical protein